MALGVDLASAATPISLRLSLLREHRRYLELALAHISAAADPKPITEMELRTALALALYYTDGPEPTVDDHLHTARRIAQTIGAKSHELKVLWMLYGIAGNSGNYSQALTYAQIFATTADTSADPMAKLRHHRMMGRALSDLGQYALAQDHVDRGLQPAREEIPQTMLNAYEIDHWVASRATRARILWLRGYPDDAKTEAEQCISDALRLGHEQTTCWALAFSVCPIAIWRGDLAEARHFANLLRKHSQSVFQHWHEWGLLYEQFLTGIASAPGRRNKPWSPDLKPKVPAQIDLFATFDIQFVEPDTLARAQADADSWCAPEILRAWADRDMHGADMTAQVGAETALGRSLDVARRHGAKAWELRTAISLAFLHRASGRISQARTALESAIGHFTQGRGTKDVQAAANLLSQLRD